MILLTGTVSVIPPGRSGTDKRPPLAASPEDASTLGVMLMPLLLPTLPLGASTNWAQGLPPH